MTADEQIDWAESVIRDLKDQDRANGTERLNGDRAINAWREEAAVHGDLDTVRAIDTLGVREAARFYESI